MKKLVSILALSLILIGCIRDSERNNPNGSLVNLRLEVSSEDLITRVEGADGYSSALGAIQNFSDEDWERYDLRYIFEVYPANDDITSTPIAKRQVKIVERFDSNNYVYFNLNMEPSKNYRFVVFADIVNQDDKSDLYYDTSDLHNITMKDDKINPMDEARDAYFATKKVYVSGQNVETIMLKRPFGKLRVVTKDYEYVEAYATPAKAEVMYYNCEIFKSFNAVEDVISTTLTEQAMTYQFTLSKETPYTAGVDAKSDYMTLFTDYLLAASEGQREVHFKLTTWDKDDKLINSIDCSMPVNIERNNLTTVSGNILTVSTDINVDVDKELKEGKTL